MYDGGKINTYMRATIMLLCFYLMVGCSNNTFYVNPKEGTVNPCGTTRVAFVVITDQYQDATFIKSEWDKASKSLSLINVPSSYSIKDELGRNKTFALKKNMSYSILHLTHGGASGQTLLFSTNNEGEIHKVSSGSCSR